MNRVKIAPSILAADHADLKGEILKAQEAGADMIHVDVADGHFAPNISMGPETVRSIRKVTKLPLDIHLMISDPEKFAEPFLTAGSDIITVHAEVVNEKQVARLSEFVRERGRKFGIALKPATPIPTWFRNQLNDIDLLLALSVNPGFPGQAFMPEVLPKVKNAVKMVDSADLEIEVDGGVDQENASSIVKAGATVLVAGASIFRKSDVKSALKQ
ncbi:MAG TPA: ribulose-phosphate 3-epimerase, partial [Candidatus Bathyarchaeia archaeon]|nr:ribulose-phosphate 3-epimerase [Candidatus Bathyarchaeia archaeon]